MVCMYEIDCNINVTLGHKPVLSVNFYEIEMYNHLKAE